MTRFHAVLLDETGCEFGADVTAADHSEARNMLREMYPESRVVQLESPEETRRREQRVYEEVERELYGEYEYEEWDS